MRIVGWRGRADQAAKVKGMFVRPEQIKELISRHQEILKARVEIRLVGNQDELTVKLEVSSGNQIDYSSTVRDVINLRAEIVKVHPNSLPSDGVIIDDQR
jgi:phenylacetate-CoA ligase